MNANGGQYTRTVHKADIDSVYLRETRRLQIFVPPGYSEDAIYPVVYCQDGEQFFNMGRIATHATKLMADGTIRPLLIVGVHVRMETRRDDYAPDGARFGAYCRFMTEEAVPYVERTYSAGRRPADRTAAGSSLGAALSLRLAIDRPDVFARVISLSGAFRGSSFVAAGGGLTRLDGLRVYMLAGLQETAVEIGGGVFDFVQMSRDMREWLDERQADVHYAEREGGHTWGLWQQYVPDALRHMYGLQS